MSCRSGGRARHPPPSLSASVSGPLRDVAATLHRRCTSVVDACANVRALPSEAVVASATEVVTLSVVPLLQRAPALILAFFSGRSSRFDARAAPTSGVLGPRSLPFAPALVALFAHGRVRKASISTIDEAAERTVFDFTQHGNRLRNHRGWWKGGRRSAAFAPCT